jgi:hypothetical protein
VLSGSGHTRPETQAPRRSNVLEKRMKWPVIAALAIVSFVAIAPRGAWAWGDQGHKVICEIAFRLAQPSTRAEIQKLIGNDERARRQ